MAPGGDTVLVLPSGASGHGGAGRGRLVARAPCWPASERHPRLQQSTGTCEAQALATGRPVLGAAVSACAPRETAMTLTLRGPLDALRPCEGDGLMP